MQPFKPQSEILANAPHGHEEGEVAVNGILVFLALLAASCLLVFVICYGMRYLIRTYYLPWTNPHPTHWQQKQMDAENQGMEAEKARYAHTNKPAPTEAMEVQMQMDQAVQKFPQPRLQTDDAQDMASMQQHEDHMLKDYMWIDPSAKRVTMPIDQAMDKVVADHTIQTTPITDGAQ